MSEAGGSVERLRRWDGRPLVEMSIGFADQWAVVLPRVFRYLDQAYVDAFFDSGALRLSSFARFAQHADEQRQDSEGTSLNVGFFRDDDSPAGGTTVVSVSMSGTNAYVLCGSIVESEQLLDDFDVDGCFVVEDCLGFANAIRRHLPGCTGGMQGHCIYSPRGRRIQRELSQDPRSMMEGAKLPDGTTDMAALVQMNAAITGTEQVLVKSARFRAQAEYRFLWRVAGTAADYIDITCPEAVQFCKRVTGSS